MLGLFPSLELHWLEGTEMLPSYLNALLELSYDPATSSPPLQLRSKHPSIIT